MKKSCIFLWMVIGAIAQLYSSTNIPGGNVSGTWTLAGSPYNVMGEITIPVGSILVIEPGVTVNFSGTFKFNVNGQLLAVGSADNPILFTAVTKWRGLRIVNGNSNGQDSTRLVHCNFTNGQATGTSPDTYGGAIYANNSGDLLIRACSFYYNIADARGGAIYLTSSAARIEKSLFHHNNAAQNGGAIYNVGAAVIMTKLTFAGNSATTNGGAIYQSGSGAINMSNSILWDDMPNEILVATGGSVTVTYSDIEGGYTGTGNINVLPSFVNPNPPINNYSLMPCSPCVDAGDPASPLDPDGTRADMGALYFHHLPGSILAGGNVSGTWYASVSPYYVCDDLTVPLGSDLLIEPGVEIRFTGGSRLNVSGRLLALGTSPNPILFTSFDTTGFYSGTWAGWEGVRINSSNTNGQDSTLMVYCRFEYVYTAGTPVYLSSSSDVRIEHCLVTDNTPSSYAVYVNSSDALIKSCEISHNEGYGVYVTGSAPIISSCQLLDNSAYSVYCMSSALPVITGCTFDVNASVPIRCYPNAVKGIHDNTYIGTQYNYIYVIGGTLSLDSQWENPGIYYRLSGTISILGMDGPDNVTTLTLEPGTTIRFTSQTALTVGHISDPGQPGALVATGTAGQNISFRGTSSSPGYWQGIVFNDYSDDSQCRLEYCTVEYGGYSINSNIYTVNSSPQIINSIIRYSSAAGVRDTTTYLGNPSVNLINCQLTNNATNGVYCSQNSQAVVSGCTFEANASHPILCWANAPRNFHNNTYNGYTYGGNIYVKGDTICLDSYWENIGLSYSIQGNLLIQGKDGPDQVTTLQLAPGTEIMIWNASIFVGHASDPNLPGALIAVGTPDQLIHFYPTEEMPMSGLWGGIVFQNYSDDSQCRLEYCWLEYGGATPYSNIHIVNASPRISHTCSMISETAGIYVDNSSSEITNCVFLGDFIGITLDDSPVSFRNNAVINCTHAINNSSFFSAEILHNCFHGYSSFSTYALPPGLGTLMMNNFNGYPCDGFYNILCDPLWNWNTFHLTESSPCINAGVPSDPLDPDYTITDMGLYHYPIDGLPVLEQVMDVPNDQGKFVHVVWSKSPLDGPNSLCEITGYSVWRRDDLGKNTNTLLLPSPGSIIEKIKETSVENEVTYGYQDGSQVWTFITQVPAIGLEQYAVVAPTLFDSVASSINYATFRVYAHTNYAPMYFPAVPDSGYSVDNLAPHVPENLTAALVINQVDLEWNSVPDEDFQYYAVYRSTDPYVFPDVPFAMTIDTLFADTSPLTGTAYYVVTAFDFNGNDSEYSNVAQVSYSPGVVLNLKIFLEGPFMGAVMNTMLNNWGYLPLSQPYNISPWNYTGSEAVASIPNANVVDWVLLELRETTGGPGTATSATVVARKALFILANGDLVDVDGVSLPVINITVTANLYAVIWHRNHLAVMSSTPLLPSGGVYTYDFTTGADKFYGGMLGCKQLGPGKWGMISGDGNANKQVNNSDKNDVWRPQSGTSGYKSGDFSLDGQVNNVDKLDKWAPNSGKSSQVPN